MTTPLRLVVFDMDGTLIDSQALIKAAMATAFAGCGLVPPHPDEVLGIVGLSLPEAMRSLRPAATGAEVAALAEGYKNAFVALRAQGGAEASAPLYPGAQDALGRLSRRDDMLLGVATGKARRGLDHAINAHGWAGIFQTAHCADDHPSKPSPSMLHACLADTGVEAPHGVMVGDTEFDIAMGRAAGMRTVAVSWGYHPLERLLSAGADIVIDHFDALDGALAQLWGEA